MTFKREGINHNVLSEMGGGGGGGDCRDPRRFSKTLGEWRNRLSVCVYCLVVYYPNNHQ